MVFYSLSLLYMSHWENASENPQPSHRMMKSVIMIQKLNKLNILWTPITFYWWHWQTYQFKFHCFCQPKSYLTGSLWHFKTLVQFYRILYWCHTFTTEIQTYGILCWKRFFRDHLCNLFLKMKYNYKVSNLGSFIWFSRWFAFKNYFVTGFWLRR